MEHKIENVQNVVYIDTRTHFCRACYRKFPAHEMKGYEVGDMVSYLCHRCEEREKSQDHRNPWTAALLSLIIPGLGQYYNKQDSHIGLIVVALMVSIFTIVPLLIIGPIAAIDAFAAARWINKNARSSPYD